MRKGNQVVEGAKPTLNVQHLQILVSQASLGAAESIAADYMAHLPRIVEWIVRAVGARDEDLALDPSRNLKTKSWLIGALRMNQLCSELELAVALADWETATAVARAIELHLPRLQKALMDAPDLAFRPMRSSTLQSAMAS